MDHPNWRQPHLLAIPHGTNEAKASIKRTAISFVRNPDGID